ncbi:MAG: hypothetical protein K9G41_10465 [Flavobacteriales bacterium]|nr:hypothetical protein [Flavobacteriales bacterium]
MKNEIASATIHEFALECQILESFLPIINSYSDYLVLNSIISELVFEKLRVIQTLNKLDNDNFSILYNLVAHFTNRLDDWSYQFSLNKVEYKHTAPSKILLSKINLKNKNKRFELIELIDKKTTFLQKCTIARLINYNLKGAIFDRMTQLNLRNEIFSFWLAGGYGSGVLTSNPAHVFSLDKNTIKLFLGLQLSKFNSNYDIKDKEVLTGFKKPIIIDLEKATKLFYIELTMLLIDGLINNNLVALEKLKRNIDDAIYFFTSEDDLSMPSDFLYDKFSRKLNFHTVLKSIRTAAELGNATVADRMATLDFFGDFEKRKFFINLPTEFSWFSQMSNWNRNLEYEKNPYQFILVNYVNEHIRSESLAGIRALKLEVESFESQLKLDENLNNVLTFSATSLNNAKDASIIGLITYAAAKGFNASEPLDSAATAAVVEYVRLTFMKQK